MTSYIVVVFLPYIEETPEAAGLSDKQGFVFFRH